MAGGIKIQFLADVRDFLRGTKDVEKSLDDVADSLDDIAKDAASAGEKAGKELGDGITDGAKDADKALDKLEKSFKDALDEASTKSKKAGDDLGDGVKKGAHKASEGMDDFRANTEANLKETAASFGSVEDALDGIQGLAAEALEGFGPAGVAAGAAVALGIGVVSSKLTEIADKANEAAEAAGEFALAWRDAGTDVERLQLLADGFDEVGAKIGDTKHAWELWQKDAATNAQEFAKALDLGVISTQDLDAAFRSLDVGDRIAAGTKASKALQEQLDKNVEAWDNTKVETQLAVGTLEKHVALTQDETDALKNTKRAIDEKVQSDKAAEDQLRALAKISGLTVEAYLDQQEAAKAAADAQASFVAAVEDSADPLDSYNAILEAKTTAEQKAAQATADATKSTKDTWETYANDVVVTIDDMIHDLNAKAANRKEFEHNLRLLASKGGGALVAELRAKGPEAAGATVDMLAHAKSAKVKALATAYGKETGAAAGKGVADGVTARTDDVTLSLNRALRTATRATAEDFKQNPPEVPVKAKVDTRGADATIKALAQTVTVTLDYRLGKQKP